MAHDVPIGRGETTSQTYRHCSPVIASVGSVIALSPVWLISFMFLFAGIREGLLGAYERKQTFRRSKLGGSELCRWRSYL